METLSLARCIWLRGCQGTQSYPYAEPADQSAVAEGSGGRAGKTARAFVGAGSGGDAALPHQGTWRPKPLRNAEKRLLRREVSTETEIAGSGGPGSGEACKECESELARASPVIPPKQRIN